MKSDEDFDKSAIFETLRPQFIVHSATPTAYNVISDEWQHYYLALRSPIFVAVFCAANSYVDLAIM
jgi:hypothetical protein